MSRPLLAARNELGEPRVERPPLRRCGARQTAERSRGWVKRSALPVDLEDAGLESLAETGSAPRPAAELDEAHRRVGERSDDPRDLVPGSTEAVERARERAPRESAGIGSSSPGLDRRLAAPARSRARARRTDSRPRSPRSAGGAGGEDRADARSQQLVERAHAEWAELDRGESPSRDGPAQPGRHLVAGSQEGGDRLAFEPRQRIPEHRERRRVEPLDVVDREQDALAPASVRRADRKANATRPSSAGGPSDSESASAASSARRCGRGNSGKTSRRRRRADRPGPTNEKPPRPRRGGRRAPGNRARPPPRAGEPQRRLADPGLAAGHGGPGRLCGRIKEIEESGELLLPARGCGTLTAHAYSLWEDCTTCCNAGIRHVERARPRTRAPNDSCARRPSTQRASRMELTLSGTRKRRVWT